MHCHLAAIHTGYFRVEHDGGGIIQPVAGNKEVISPKLPEVSASLNECGYNKIEVVFRNGISEVNSGNLESRGIF